MDVFLITETGVTNVIIGESLEGNAQPHKFPVKIFLNFKRKIHFLKFFINKVNDDQFKREQYFGVQTGKI
jgi:hypothetical protein